MSSLCAVGVEVLSSASAVVGDGEGGDFSAPVTSGGPVTSEGEGATSLAISVAGSVPVCGDEGGDSSDPVASGGKDEISLSISTAGEGDGSIV